MVYVGTKEFENAHIENVIVLIVKQYICRSESQSVIPKFTSVHIKVKTMFENESCMVKFNAEYNCAKVLEK